jgi:3',5'-cyclic AMP phosphodiesterase CpdA
LLHLSDLHLSASGYTGDGVDPDRSLALVLDACTHLDDLSAVVVTGDVADDGSTRAYERARASLLAFAKERGAHLVVSTGNHDDRSNFAEILGHGHFRPDGSVSGQAGPADRICATSTIAGLRVITLDSLVPGKWFGHLGADQLHWLRGLLDAEPDLPTVIAFHHPPITLDVEIQRRVRLEDSDDLASVLQHGNPVTVLCGHFHQQIAGQLSGVPTWVTPGVYTRIDHLTGPEGKERATAGGSATLVDLTKPSSPSFATLTAKDPNLGAEVYVTSLAELDEDLRAYGIPTPR